LRRKIPEWLTADIFNDQEVETNEVSPIIISCADWIEVGRIIPNAPKQSAPIPAD